MRVDKGQWTILLVNLLYLLVFGVFYLSRQNYEFLLYIGVIVFFFVVIIATNEGLGIRITYYGV